MLRRGATPPPLKSHDEARQQGITRPPLTSRMQFPQSPHLQQTANGRISTIRVHNLECLEGNDMRRCPRLMSGWRDRRAWLRCPWATGPGRTSRQRAERSPRRGRLAGEPPPPAHTAARPAGQHARRPEHQRHHNHKHKKAGQNLSVPARPQCSVAISSARHVSVVHDHRVTHVGPVVDELRGADGHVYAAVGAAVAAPAEG